MAATPRTRTPKQKPEVKAPASRILRITLGGRSLEIDVMQFGPADDRVSRAQAGITISSLIESDVFGVDTMLLLWWLARRKNGEPGLHYYDVENEFPTFAHVAAANFDLEEVTPDPEA